MDPLASDFPDPGAHHLHVGLSTLLSVLVSSGAGFLFVRVPIQRVKT